MGTDFILVNDTLWLSASAVIFCVAVLVSKRLGGLFTRALALCATLIYGCLTMAYVVVDRFTGEGFNEAFVYHLRSGFGGAGWTENLPVAGLAAIMLLGILAVAWGQHLMMRRWALAARAGGGIQFRTAVVYGLLAVAAFLSNPAVHSSIGLAQARSFFAAGPGEVNEEKWNRQFRALYEAPRVIERVHSNPSLVVLYLESMESGFFDQDVFPGLMSGTLDVLGEGARFTRVEQLPGTGWTIAGMVASQCGLPLVTPSTQNSMSAAASIYPGAACLGDLLAQSGYELVFMQGSSLEFSGLGKFYRGHGFRRVMGRDELRLERMTREGESGWGVTDDVLLDSAYAEFDRLAAGEAPFGLFVATIDSHFDGHDIPSCDGVRYPAIDDPLLHTLACLDGMIVRFIRRLLDHDTGEDLVIAVVSDHLAMTNRVMDRLAQKPRRLTFSVLGPGLDRAQVDTPGSLLDVAPTLLDIMGREPSLGLGRSLLRERSGPLPDPEFLREHLTRWRSSLMEFWLFPAWEDGIRARAWAGSLVIGDRPLKIPLLLRLKPDGSSIPYFEGVGMSDLVGHVLSFDTADGFLMVHRCDWLNELDPDDRKAGQWCALLGKLGTVIQLESVGLNTGWSPEQLRAIVDLPDDPDTRSENIRQLKRLQAQSIFR